MIRYSAGKKIGRLHVIISDDDRSRPHRSHSELALYAIRGGADTIQYRSKSGNIRQMIAEGFALRHVCSEYGVTFIVNDRVDIALALDADGVHLGSDDMPLNTARRILGSERIIGATVRNVGDLKAAEKASANYVGLGPVFATATKELPIAPLGLTVVRAVTEVASIPVIGIAGISEENVADVIRAGAYGIAVVGAVGRADDPELAAQVLRRRINEVIDEAVR